ncbi:MAG: aldehyde dehydrogenase family protein [Sphingomonadaceae bacterium]
MQYKNYIGGKWVDSESDRSFESLDPATGEVVGIVPRSSPADVERAVEAAEVAFRSWRLTPAPKRGEILFRVGQLLQERKEQLARLVTREMGKVIAEGRGDVQEAIDMTYYMAGEGRRLFGHTVPSELPNKFGTSMRDPVGVVAAITPWNFPIAIPSWKLTAALICGNVVVFKPASDTPVLAAELVKLYEEAGLPGGVLNLVIGGGGEAGNALVNHPRVDVVSFTGSTETGRSVLTETAGRIKRVSLEMGGKNAIMVMEDADLDLAVEGILWSAFGTAGQRCTAASRVIVHRAVERDLTDRLVERARKMRLGHGLDPQTDVGPVINARQLERIHGYTQVGVQEGARLLCGGEIAREGELARGNFYPPTIFAEVRPHMRIAQEEIFGPTLGIIAVDSLEEAIRVNNDTRFGLSSSIYTRDVNKAFTASRDVTTGVLYVNAGTIGAEVQLPFGGTRGTGNGHREAAWTALDVFTEWKTVYVDYSGRLQRAQIDLVEGIG